MVKSLTYQLKEFKNVKDAKKFTMHVTLEKGLHSFNTLYARDLNHAIFLAKGICREFDLKLKRVENPTDAS